MPENYRTVLEVGDYALKEREDGALFCFDNYGNRIKEFGTPEEAAEAMGEETLCDSKKAPRFLCGRDRDGDLWLAEDLIEVDGRDGLYYRGDTVYDYEGCLRLYDECQMESLRGYGTEYILSSDLDENWEWCERCDEYVPKDEYDSNYGACCRCAEEERDDSAYIREYHSNRKEDWYRGLDEEDDMRRGIGFELEVDGNDRSCDPRCDYNNEVARRIIDECLEGDEDEVVFETDGSLDTGFEIISMPHTVKAFWEKRKRFGKMLGILREEGFKSHDAGSCGLHVHVSKTMFGKTKKEQDENIGKVHKFYYQHWSDLLRASRRKSLCYCEQNEARDEDGLPLTSKNNKKDWSRVVKGDHYKAINDRPDGKTVEFRLGRGTLNERSFFAWIDLTLTIVRNSHRTERSLSSAREWLRGISNDTAEYLRSRLAFMDAIRELKPKLFLDEEMTPGNDGQGDEECA